MADEINKIIDVTPEDIYLISQQIQRRYVKFEILNRQWVPTGEIKGRVISGNISIDATNNIRRTASLEIIVSYESMEEAANFVMQNYIKLFCGIQKNIDSTVTWYNFGMFIINNYSYKFDPKTRTLTVTLSDLMSDLNGDRGGVLHAYTVIAKNSERIDTVIENLLLLCGYPNSEIEPIGVQRKTDITLFDDTLTSLNETLEVLREKGYTEEEIEELLNNNPDELVPKKCDVNNEDYLIPYDLNFSVGVTAYEIIEKLVSLYPYYRMRFSVDGTFIVDKTVLEEDESTPIITAEMLDKVVISEDKSIDWTKIKNHIEVWGKDGKYYGEAEDDNMYSPFQAKSIGVLRAVYSGDVYDNIYDRYKHPQKVEGLMKDQAKYEAEIARLKSLKPDSDDEKAINDKKIVEVTKLLNKTKSSIRADIYVYGNEMAADYAKKLLYETCRINDSLTLQTVFMPFINEVDFKIQHRTELDGSVNTYVLKGVNHDLKNGTSTLNCVRFYDELKQSELLQLDYPRLLSYSVEGMTITINASAVNHATSYLLYIDFNVAEISNSPKFVYTISDGHEGRHSFYVTATATAYRESNRDEVLWVNMSAGIPLVDENGNEIVSEEYEKIIGER